jgi:hypothetical protein
MRRKASLSASKSWVSTCSIRSTYSKKSARFWRVMVTFQPGEAAVI